MLQFSVALFTGMVAATFIPSVRRAIPRAVEVGLWIALLTVCILAVSSISDPNARNLSQTTLWAVDQLINTVAGLVLTGAMSWISGNRFEIASWLVILA